MSTAKPDVPGRPTTVEKAGDVTVIRELEEPQVSSDSALRRFRRVAYGEAVTDALCIVAALLILRASGVQQITDEPLTLAVSLVLWLGVFHAFGLYRPRTITALEEARRLVAACAVGVVVLLVSEVWWNEIFSRSRLVLLTAITLGLEFLTRRLWRWYVRAGKRRGTLALRTLVVGANDEAAAILRAIGPTVRGFKAIGLVSTSDGVKGPTDASMIGTIVDLEDLVTNLSVECLFVASSAVRADEMTALTKLARQRSLELRISANLPMILTPRVAIQTVEDVAALAVSPTHLSRGHAFLKRSFDLVVAAVGLLICSPFFLAVALAIKTSSKGPVLYRQPRVTKDGRIFSVCKFRTMDPDRPLPDDVVDLTQPYFKLEDDPRLTSVGRFLRKTSLDEVPQLWNVLRGEMSLVGPRPLPAEQVRANPELLAPRHEVRSGITGWWQINGRSDVQAEEAIQMDLFYVENWSLSLDLYIILKTVGAVLAGQGAR